MNFTPQKPHDFERDQTYDKSDTKYNKNTEYEKRIEYIFQNTNNGAYERECPSCFILMIDPIKLPCGHRICMQCVDDKQI